MRSRNSQPALPFSRDSFSRSSVCLCDNWDCTILHLLGLQKLVSSFVQIVPCIRCMFFRLCFASDSPSEPVLQRASAGHQRKLSRQIARFQHRSRYYLFIDHTCSESRLNLDYYMPIHNRGTSSVIAHSRLQSCETRIFQEKQCFNRHYNL